MTILSTVKALMSSSARIDENFEYVTALLHGDGTNGAQNNTFVDGSTNNFTITRNGNTTQGSFTPYGSNWSNYFDGSGDYLTVASNAAFGYGTGDFTVEMWYYPQAFGTATILYDQRTSGATEVVPTLYTDTSSGTLYYYVNGANRITGPNLSLNTWQHIAVSRSGTSTKLFVNGAQVGSTYSDSNNYATSLVSIGTYAPSPASYYITGFVSNVRIVKGTAVYTSAFTPPTAPLTAISGTSLLTCQSNRFIDNSSNAFAITVNGNTSVSRFSPFSPASAYSTTANGGSAYFDGTGDYLSGSSWSSAGNFGTGNFTVEGWFYVTGAPNSNQVIWSCSLYPNATGLYLQYSGGGATQLNVGSGGVAIISSSAGWSFNEWHHVALVRSSGTLTMYIDGVSRGSASFTSNCTDGLQYIGRPNDVADYMMQGYISNFRIVKSAVYTAAFTPPTAPVTAITNTSLLLNATNAAIYDSAMINDLETVGNAQISTAQSKFGTGAMYFSGGTDRLQIPVTPAVYLGTTYTIEAWVYYTGASIYAARPIVSICQSFQGGFTELGLGLGTGGTINFAVRTTTNGTVTYIASSTISTNTWYHVAASVSSGSARLFINGTQVGSTTTFAEYPISVTQYAAIGGFGHGWVDNGIPAGGWIGYIDDFRITKGVARYTSNFTPPAQAFPDR